MRKIAIVILLLFICSVNSGCWSKNEIENLGFVLGCGISKTEAGLYEVVVQFANPSAIVAEGPDQRDIYTIMKSEGLSVFDALRNLSIVAGRRLYFPHLKVLIIHEDVAKEGIREVLGFLKQDEEVRLEHEVLISKLPPEEILDTPNTLGVIPAQALDTIARRNVRANGKVYVAELREALGMVSNPYVNFVTGFVEILPAPTEKEKELLAITKIAIFDNDKLAGYLDYEEGQAYNFLTNKFENGLIVFEKRTGDIITVEMLGASTKITPGLSNGKVKFNIEIEAQGNLAERIPSFGKEGQINLEDVKEQLDKVIEDKINKAIENAQNDYKVDYYNLSKYFNRKHPKEFKELRDDWNYHFSQAEVNVTVDTKIIHPALGTFGGQK